MTYKTMALVVTFAVILFAASVWWISGTVPDWLAALVGLAVAWWFKSPDELDSEL